MVLIVLEGTLAAADKDVKAKIVHVDAEKKTLTVSQEDGEKRYVFGSDAKVFSPTGAASKEGFKDKRLVAGAEVQLVLTANGQGIREIRLVAAAAAKDREKEPAKKESAKEPAKRATPVTAKKDSTEIKGKLAKVDIDKKTFTITTEDGGNLEFTVGDDTKFLGPRGGATKEKMKDNRFVPGSEVRVVPGGDGKAVEAVYLPVRKREEKKEK